MFHLLRIYNKNFWKSIFGPLITFLLPITFIWLIVSIYTFTYNYNPISLSSATIPTVIFTCSYIILLILLPQAIFEIKDSILIKQLKTSSIKLWHVLLVGLIYYSCMAVIAFFLSIISSIITPEKFVIEQTLKMYSQTNWWMLLFVLFLNICMAGSFGTMIASVLKRSSTINMIGVSVIFLSLLLGGLMVPIMIASEQLPVVWYASYFDFIRYGTTQAYEALYSVPSKFNVFGSNMFDVSTPYEAFATDLVPIKFTILREHDKILNLSIPYLSTILFTLVSVKTFKI